MEEDEWGHVQNPFVYKLHGSYGVRLLWLPVSSLCSKYANFKHYMSHYLNC